MDVMDDGCIVLALALALRKKNKKNQKKRMWMDKFYNKRREFTEEKLFHELKLSSANDFRNCLRMNEEIYEDLIRLISPKIKKKDTRMRNAITVHQRLAITLQFLATGDSYTDLRFSNAISVPSIGGIVIETCEAIIAVLKDYIIIPATYEEWKEIAEDFSLRWNFPNCIGVLGGQHIAIKKPTSSGKFYFNYKKFFSVVLVAVVNANHEFMMVDIGINGGATESEILNQTVFGKAYSQNVLNSPDPSILPMSNKKLPYVFVGDHSFSLSDYVMNSYTSTQLTEQQKVFNYRLKRVYRILENTFGILVSRFAVLQRPIGLSTDKVQTVVLACCYLHNFLLNKASEQYISHGSIDRELLDKGTVTQGLWRNECKITSLEKCSSRNTTKNAEEIRTGYCSYFNNEGQVPWQKAFLNEC